VLTANEVAELARAHADHEGRGEFGPVMATLVDDPIYEFHPLDVQLRGKSAVLRYYQRVRRDYSPHVENAELIGLFADTAGAVLEYAVRVRIDAETRDERLVASMPVHGDRFGGERIHSSDALLRLLLGEMLAEAQPIPPRVFSETSTL